MTSKDHTENKAMLSNHRKQLPFKWRITCRWLPLEYFTHPFSRFEPVKATQTVKASGGSMPKIYKSKSIIQQILSRGSLFIWLRSLQARLQKNRQIPHGCHVLYNQSEQRYSYLFIMCFLRFCTFVCISMSKWRQRTNFRTS